MNKINKSIELYKEAKLHMPGGVNSPVRAFKNINGNPIFFKKAKGPYLIDADNNKYIDYIGSWGPMILGHSNPKIIKAVSRQLELGTSYGAPTSIESDTAKLIKKCFPSIQKIRMVNSGTEATLRGFRVSLGGAQELYGIKPDLTTLGKVIGGGLPVGAFGGKKKVMDCLAPNGPVYQAGTLSGKPLAMAAGSTLIKLLIDKNPYKDLESKAKNLLEGMKEIFNRYDIPFSTCLLYTSPSPRDRQ